MAPLGPPTSYASTWISERDPVATGSPTRTTLRDVHGVVDVELERDVELRIRYDDGVLAVFPVGELRQACPCAGCRSRREQSLDVGPGDAVAVTDAELHGNWGIAIRWSDGHDTGIYAWEHLRRWWDAGIDSLPSAL